MSLLDISGLSHAYGDKLLYKDAEFHLYKGEHVGVVGQNGAGKSTLIQICAGLIIPDQGTVVWQPNKKIGYLDQYAQMKQDLTILEFLQTAFQTLYELEQKMLLLYNRCAGGDTKAWREAEACQNRLEAEACQNRLEAEDFYSVDVLVEKVANGLGLTALGLDRPLSQLSGGQRAKVILAKLLLEEPDVLLLDEPTNFLDKEHVEWLAGYLSASERAFLLVSHDAAFLEKTSAHICDISRGSIRKFTGSYTFYLAQKQRMQEDAVRRYQEQQKEIKKTEEYIRRNIAGVNSKNAKGRRKQLERVERLARPDELQVKPVFTFQALPCNAQEVLHLKKLTVGYNTPLLHGLNFSVQNGQKIVITGFNGIGKSTLFNTLAKKIPLYAGDFHFADTVSPGYYEQDLFWKNDGLTPAELLSEEYPFLSDKEIRQHLFRCGIFREHVLQPIGSLSGGEQAKLKLCLLTLSPCNFLLMDEPTNHLDAAAKEALRTALASFQGTVLLVSHEQAFYQGWAHKIINIEKSR